MRSSRCIHRDVPPGRRCPTCGAAADSSLSRRDFLIQAGLLGAAALGAPTVLVGCPTQVPPSTQPPNSFDVEWSLVNPYGIYLFEPPTSVTDIWGSGHVTDLLEVGPDLLVAAETGGVWRIRSSGAATPLSYDWDSPDINCFGRGPAGLTHVYAGGTRNDSIDGGALYVTDTSATDPLDSPWLQIPLPSVGIVNDLIVLPSSGRVVLATSNGIWWAAIPAEGSPYTWTRALGLPVDDGSFFAIVAGPGETILASAGPATAPANGHFGIFRGAFSGADLMMSAAAISGITATSMAATALASGGDGTMTMYASSADSAGLLLGILTSLDGGMSWSAVPGQLTGEAATLAEGAGEQGNAWNNCIAVDPQNAQTLAFGWQGGPFESLDGGATFVRASGDAVKGFHMDIHALLYGSSGGLWIGSDGGVLLREANGEFSSRFNKNLAALQFYTPTGRRQFMGSFATSAAVPGLIAGGVQDNGNVYCRVDEGAPDDTWHQLDGNDGGPVIFLDSGEIVRETNGSPLARAEWDESAGALVNTVDILVGNAGPMGTPPSGSTLAGGCLARVGSGTGPAVPSTMLAVHGNGANVYGLFAAPSPSTLRFDYLTSLPLGAGESIVSVASLRGSKVLAGVSGSSTIYWFDRASPSNVIKATGLPTATGKTISVGPIVIVEDSPAIEAYALLFDSSNVPWTGAIYHTTDGTAWSPVDESGLPASPFYALEIDRQVIPNVLLVATDAGVFAKRTGSSTWENISRGLPRRPHCSDLRLGKGTNGDQYLYLATYGWSVWRSAWKGGV